jgi:putative flippase GtrA
MASRFALTGVLATGVHITCAWWLLTDRGMPVLWANLLAFCCAFGISFTGNYYWTFRAPGNPRRAMLRFALIALSGLAANTFLLAWLVDLRLLTPLMSIVTAALIIPLITYMASRAWGFARESDHATKSRQN